MTKSIKIILTVLIGGFFSIATLEIDVFDYDNTFFDSYDSYVRVDSKVIQRVLQIDLRQMAIPEIILPSFHRPDFDLSSEPNKGRSLLLPCHQKIFIVKSCLLI